MSGSNWLGKQIKGYVEAQIPSWANLSNNPMSRGIKAPLPEKPEFTTNFIYVGSDCFVQPADTSNPFIVKEKYV